MRTKLFLAALISVNLLAQQTWQGPGVDFKHGRLKVSDNKRYLVFADGTPFFYLGDTGWELFHRLDKKEAEQYLEKRREQGFTVIQAVALAELDGLNAPNAEGEKPLINNDPLTPNEKYFQHVDWVIKKAEEKGLYVALLPTWGDKIDNRSWGTGPVVFNKDNAFTYGQWIGKRYREYINIIWINGGDRSGGDQNYEIFDALAKGVKSADPNHLMTFHPYGEHSSAEWFHDAAWLDFNMVQTGHCQRSYAVYRWLLKPTYDETPVKPCMDGEPRYEDHPVCWKPDLMGWYDDADVRQAAYWNMLSGACGHTYGCNSIWQFMAPGRNPLGYARHSWQEVLSLPGASQMIFLRKLFERKPFQALVPAQELVGNPYVPETDYIIAATGRDFAYVYTPSGLAIDVKLNFLKWSKTTASWYNPRTGETTPIGSFECTATKSFAPPAKGRGQDWVLILE